MNTSKDFIRKPLKRISNRKKKGQGFFQHNHSYSLINRNSSLPTRPIGYPDYVLPSQNTRSYTRLHSSRQNSGYLKHIHSQSISREKEPSTMDCYEEYTLRKIRTTSDMIKQHLMSPEHTPLIATDTNIESEDSINEPKRLSGETSKISDNNKEYSLTKLKRKSKSSEEIARLEIKQRRKNELREKFKREQKSSDVHNAKEISDKILKHISKLNNERIMDFLNTGDSRYGEAFTYICKQKSFEVTKALRDLSRQEKPADCEIVNAIIPDFSIKIEQLPINIIRELSLTFDELQKNMGDSCLSDANLHLFNGEQTSDDLSMFLQQICSDEMNGGNLSTGKTENQNHADNQNVIIENSTNCGNGIELIEVLDSDEELPYSKDNDMSIKPTHQIINNMEGVVDCPSIIVNQSDCLNYNIPENDFPCNLSFKEEEICSNQIINSNRKDLTTETNPSSISLQFNENNSNQIVDEAVHVLSLDSVKVEINSEEDIKPVIPPEITEANSQPKVGSVWVSKNIFETSSGWNGIENELDQPDKINAENTVDGQNINEELTKSASEQNLESAEVVVKENCLEILNNTTLIRGNNQIDSILCSAKNVETTPVLCETSIPNLEHCNSDVDSFMNTTSVLASNTKDNEEIVRELDNKNDKLKDVNEKESVKILQASDSVFDGSSNIATVNKDLNNLPNSFEFACNNFTTSGSVSIGPSNISAVDKDLNDTPHSFDLACKNFSKSASDFCGSSNISLTVNKDLNEMPNSFQLPCNNFVETPEICPANVQTYPENINIKEKNVKESSKNKLKTSCSVSGGTSNISTVNKDSNDPSKSNELTHNNSSKTPETVPAKVHTHLENDLISLTIKSFDKPKNLKDAINFMTVIDKQIEILTKLRQDIFIGLSEIVDDSELGAPKSKKRKFESTAEIPESSANKSSINKVQVEKRSEQSINSNTKKSSVDEKQNENKSAYRNNTKNSTANEQQKEKKSAESNTNINKSSAHEAKIDKRSEQESNLTTKNSGINGIQLEKGPVENSNLNTEKSIQKDVKIREKPKQFESLKSVNAVVLFCKILFDKDEFIIGTDDGKIQYHSIFGKKMLISVSVGNSPISFLECVRIGDRIYICTGNTAELELKILRYKKRFIEQRVHLEDSIQAVRNEWGFFFIGGKRGYLTRYDWRKDRIQYEDSISSSSIKDLAATREGPRKILVILFEDAEGVAHIHVRDAMTALHIRTIIDMKNVRSMYLRYSSVYLFTDEQISVYNCCDGNFIRKVPTQQPFSIVKSRGNLLIMGGTDGIYGYNMRANRYLGCLKSDISPASLFPFEQKIICGTSSMKVEVFDVPDDYKDLLEYK